MESVSFKRVHGSWELKDVGRIGQESDTRAQEMDLTKTFKYEIFNNNKKTQLKEKYILFLKNPNIFLTSES